MTLVTRLDVLRDARKLAEEIGAVKDGTAFFEVGNGDRRSELRKVQYGDIAPEKVCGVCIAGACALAAIIGGYDPYWRDPWAWMENAVDAAEEVLGAEAYDSPGPITQEITDRGTPYVLAVLDRMMEREEAAC